MRARRCGGDAAPAASAAVVSHGVDPAGSRVGQLVDIADFHAATSGTVASD